MSYEQSMWMAEPFLDRARDMQLLPAVAAHGGLAFMAETVTQAVLAWAATRLPTEVDLLK